VRYRHLDVLVRSADPLPSGVVAQIESIFADATSAFALGGGLNFKVGPLPLIILGPAFTPVHDVARVQRDREVRHHFREAKKPERKRILRELVDLPANDNQLHLRGDDHRQQADHEPAERRVPEDGVRVVGRAGG